MSLLVVTDVNVERWCSDLLDGSLYRLEPSGNRDENRQELKRPTELGFDDLLVKYRPRHRPIFLYMVLTGCSTTFVIMTVNSGLAIVAGHCYHLSYNLST